jgi:pimeloyl-ACP methyl ester carboxylesterase
MKRVLLAALAGAVALAVARPPREVPYPELADELDTAVGGARHIYRWLLGEVSYRVDGAGTPLVLVHGINAAASSFELRRNFRSLGVYFEVYAPDLLGFGLSDRPAVFYTAQIYTDLLADFLRHVVRQPAHLLASSLSSAYAVRVAQEHPELVRSLVLICPTGIEQLSDPPTRGQRVADFLFGLPGLGDRLFAALASRPSVHYFLRTITYYQRQAITREVVDGYHHTGQRPGARWAPRAFLGGRLNQNIAEAFARLNQPVLLVWGKEARTTPLDTAPAFLERNPRATLKVFPESGLVPHDEQAEAFNRYVHSWLKEQES